MLWALRSKRVRLVVHRGSALRGIVEGRLQLHDKHMNVVLRDVHERYVHVAYSTDEDGVGGEKNTEASTAPTAPAAFTASTASASTASTASTACCMCSSREAATASSYHVDPRLGHASYQNLHAQLSPQARAPTPPARPQVGEAVVTCWRRRRVAQLLVRGDCIISVTAVVQGQPGGAAWLGTIPSRAAFRGRGALHDLTGGAPAPALTKSAASAVSAANVPGCHDDEEDAPPPNRGGRGGRCDESSGQEPRQTTCATTSTSASTRKDWSDSTQADVADEQLDEAASEAFWAADDADEVHGDVKKASVADDAWLMDSDEDDDVGGSALTSFAPDLAL